MLNVHHGKRFVVMAERTLLSQMLWELKEAGDGLSYKKMASRSGGTVAVSTLHAVMGGKTKDLTPRTIAGLAKILGISEAQVLAALKDKTLPQPEQANEEKEKIWAMYSDIPKQCQQDVLDLLAVLQRNHSISARKAKQGERRRAVATVARVSTPIHPPGWETQEHEGEEPILPATQVKTSKRA